MQASSGRGGRGLLPFEIMNIVDSELATPRFRSECTPAYLDIVRKFIFDNLAHRLADFRRIRGMFDALEKDVEWDEDTDLSLGASGKHHQNATLDDVVNLLQTQIKYFLTITRR